MHASIRVQIQFGNDALRERAGLSSAEFALFNDQKPADETLALPKPVLAITLCRK
jgi:hypothetical protein